MVYLAKSGISKEHEATRIARRDGIREGLVCVLTCLEPCISYVLYKNRETKKPFAERKDKFKPTMLKKISAELMKKGVYLVNVINTFLVAPPLIVSEKEINDAVDVFDEALKMADKETE